MRERAERAFDYGNDRVDMIPFSLQLPNLTTTLINWASDMKLDVPLAGRENEQDC